jgi:hypothetical protein
MIDALFPFYLAWSDLNVMCMHIHCSSYDTIAIITLFGCIVCDDDDDDDDDVSNDGDGVCTLALESA